VQGLNDPRVPATESQQMVAKIRARGGEVWYLAAKDEGHGFKKKQNRDFYQRTIVTFLQKQLGREVASLRRQEGELSSELSSARASGSNSKRRALRCLRA
jgi:hypothetical protein